MEANFRGESHIFCLNSWYSGKPLYGCSLVLYQKRVDGTGQSRPEHIWPTSVYLCICVFLSRTIMTCKLQCAHEHAHRPEKKLILFQDSRWEQTRKIIFAMQPSYFPTSTSVGKKADWQHCQNFLFRPT